MRFDPHQMSRLLPAWQSEADVELAPADSMLWARISAWLRPGHFDRLLAVGSAGHEGTPLAVHADRLTSVRERENVARAFRRCLSDACSEASLRTSRIEVDGPARLRREGDHRLRHAAASLAAAGDSARYGAATPPTRRWWWPALSIRSR